MRNRACAHCGEETLPPWKLALSGPQNPVRCFRCGGYSTTATAARARWLFMTLAAAAAAAFAIEVWGEPVGIAILVAGVVAAFASVMRHGPAKPIWPERSLVPPALIAALVPAVVAMGFQWSNGVWTWTDDAFLPVFLWALSTSVLIGLGAPIVWCLRRAGWLGYGAFALAGALPMVALAALFSSLSARPWPYLFMAALGAATALAFRFAARFRLAPRAGAGAGVVRQSA